MAEAGIQRLWANHLILRISGVFGWEFQPKNFVLQLLDPARKSPIRVAVDLRYNPTYAPDIASAAAELIERDAKGIFHLAGAETLSRFEFARRVVDAFQLPADRIQQGKILDLSPVRRPGLGGLDGAGWMGGVQAPPLGATRALGAMKEAAE